MAQTYSTWQIILFVLLVTKRILCQDRIDMDCDPGFHHRYEVCPEGYCCVRDEFLPTYVYCKKIGQLDENCTTRDNESECPCDKGLHCKANILGNFPSLYGKCRPTETTTTTVSTTPSDNNTTYSSTTPSGGNTTSFLTTAADNGTTTFSTTPAHSNNTVFSITTATPINDSITTDVDTTSTPADYTTAPSYSVTDEAATTMST